LIAPCPTQPTIPTPFAAPKRPPPRARTAAFVSRGSPVGFRVDVIPDRQDSRQHCLVGGRAVLQRQHPVGDVSRRSTMAFSRAD
jgi:hypothetical protein